jgi:hypothetical protein
VWAAIQADNNACFHDAGQFEKHRENALILAVSRSDACGASRD